MPARNTESFMEDSPVQFSKQQQRVHGRLERLVGPGAAGFFADACRMACASPPFKTQTHLVAHCLREIESAMRSVMTTVSDYDQVKEQSHRANVEAILEALGEPEDGMLRKHWLEILDANLHKRTHRRNLRPPRPLDAEHHLLWEVTQFVLDEALGRFEKKFSAVIEELDRLLEIEHPTGEDAKLVAEEVPFSPAAHRYFFERLEYPSWIPCLRARGLFSSPPPAEVDAETGGISSPSWPASRFLKRIATDAPQRVSDALVHIPETDNQLIHSDLAGAAASLPPALAVEWAEREIVWLGRQDRLYFNLPDDFAALAAHLAGGGDGAAVDAALHMTRVLLDLRPEANSE